MTEWWADVVAKFVAAFITKDRWRLYLNGLGLTMEIAFFAGIIGIILGIIIAQIGRAHV